MKLSQYIKDLQEHSLGNDVDITVSGYSEFAMNIILGQSIDIVPLCTPQHLIEIRELQDKINEYNNMSFFEKMLRGFSV